MLKFVVNENINIFNILEKMKGVHKNDHRIKNYKKYHPNQWYEHWLRVLDRKQIKIRFFYTMLFFIRNFDSLGHVWKTF